MRTVNGLRPAGLPWIRPVPAAAVLLFAMAAGVAQAQAQRAPDRLQNVEEPAAIDPTFLVSALVPGGAQYLAGDDRWVPYAAVEAWSWISFLQQRSAAHDLQRRYRDLAWQVARRVSTGERRDTAFEYYEALANPFYPSSGAFDADPTLPGVQPERQAGTYNGDVWALARALHVPGGQAAVPGSPAYEAALAYYTDNAIRPEYAWAWGDSRLEQQVFGELIRESDAAHRAATRYLGVILANHIVSAVDALVTARLRQLSGTPVRFRGGPVPDTPGRPLRWEYSVEIGF